MPINHLSGEKSPYLAQHADNPVDWYPWTEAAFEKARQEQKPILLSIGYSTCHWCHVMAHESFESQEIADVINAGFVAIKVDREERPDIDHIYMTAVTAMTGQGGWPLTVFLTPDAKPFYGGTYFPPFAKWGSPGFKDLLLTVDQAWKNDQTGILSSSNEITALLQQNTNHPPSDAESLGQYTLDKATVQLMAQFDSQYGGFGQSPKFPMGHSLSFLLGYHARLNQGDALETVEKTLTAMSRGGIYDHLGGGFHRYSVDQKWHVPHFEKMLYDQALLVFAYAEGYQTTGRESYATTVSETIDYVLRDMTSLEGGFFCAEDADSEGHEGVFYVWSKAEIGEVLGPELAALFNGYYGILPGGNVETDPHGDFGGKNILYLTRDVEPEDRQALHAARQKLFAHRGRRIRPHLDDKILTDWNGLMIGAMAYAGCVLGKQSYIDAAQKAADFVLHQLKKDRHLLHRFRLGEASIDGMLEDYAFLTFGLCHLYEATLEPRYLSEAGLLADTMVKLFVDQEKGGFFMTSANAPALIARPQDIYDGALPSGNSVAAYALLKLSYLMGNKSFAEQAKRSFQRFANVVGQAPQAYAFFLTALDLHLYPPVELTVQGTLPGTAIDNFRKIVYKRFIPGLVVKGGKSQGAWSVVVCRNGACQMPTSDLTALEQMLA